MPLTDPGYSEIPEPKLRLRSVANSRREDSLRNTFRRKQKKVTQTRILQAIVVFCVIASFLF